jgi:hypothetical protein
MKKKILKELENYLDDEKFEYENKKEYIRTGIKFSSGLYSDIIIHPLVENNVVRFIALNFIEETTPPREEYFKALLKINFDTVLGNFSRDLDDKTYLSIDFPLDQEVMTKEQFKFCLFSLVLILEKYTPLLNKILISNIPLREVFFSIEGDDA